MELHYALLSGWWLRSPFQDKPLERGGKISLQSANFYKMDIVSAFLSFPFLSKTDIPSSWIRLPTKLSTSKLEIFSRRVLFHDGHLLKFTYLSTEVAWSWYWVCPLFTKKSPSHTIQVTHHQAERIPDSVPRNISEYLNLLPQGNLMGNPSIKVTGTHLYTSEVERGSTMIYLSILPNNKPQSPPPGLKPGFLDLKPSTTLILSIPTTNSHYPF